MTASAPRRPEFGPRRETPAPRYGRPASAKAAAFWGSLRADLLDLITEAHELGIEPTATVPADTDELYAVDASAEIDEMLDDIRTLRAELRAARQVARRADRPTVRGAAAAAELEEDRLYEVDGEVYRTVRSGSGNLYAKILVSDGGGHGWEYAAGAIRHIRPGHRMSTERAIELSCQIGRCVRCGRLLTAEESVERGIGPVCITKI